MCQLPELYLGRNRHLYLLFIEPDEAFYSISPKEFNEHSDTGCNRLPYTAGGDCYILWIKNNCRTNAGLSREFEICGDVCGDQW